MARLWPRDGRSRRGDEGRSREGNQVQRSWVPGGQDQVPEAAKLVESKIMGDGMTMKVAVPEFEARAVRANNSEIADKVQPR